MTTPSVLITGASSGLVKGKQLPTADEVATAGYRAMQRGQRVYVPGRSPARSAYWRATHNRRRP